MEDPTYSGFRLYLSPYLDISLTRMNRSWGGKRNNYSETYGKNMCTEVGETAYLQAFSE